MIPGIIPVGVTTPVFAYKEGFVGSMASGGSATISLTTPQTTYRYIIVSAGGGQSSTSITATIAISVNGSPLVAVQSVQGSDPAGSSSSLSIGLFRVTGGSFSLSLSNPLSFSMNYTIAVFEIPAPNIDLVAAGASGGAPPRSFTIPRSLGGIVLVSQFGQGGSGTWADMTYSSMTKVPVSQSAQQSLAFLYSNISGTVTTSLSNNAASNRIYLATTWRVI